MTTFRRALPGVMLVAAIGCSESVAPPDDDPPPVDDPSPDTLVVEPAIVAGVYGSAALDARGTAYVWGFFRYDVPEPLPGTETFVQISPSGLCALTPEGRLTCFARAVGSAPVPVEFRWVGGTDYYGCGLGVDSVAYCWGENLEGQLGDGTGGCFGAGCPPQDRDYPAPVASGPKYVQLTVHWSYSCGLTAEGEVWCWGDPPAAVDIWTEPQRVESAVTFAAVTAGDQHLCGLTEGGSAYCWGDGWLGEIGDGAMTGRGQPTAVAGGHRFTAIEAGQESTCGVTESDGVYCWGSWSTMSLRRFTSVDWPNVDPIDPTGDVTWPEPRGVPGSRELRTVSVGRSHACGLGEDGAGYCWGAVGNGDLGIGYSEEQDDPVAVAEPIEAVAVQAGHFASCARATDGQAWCWGLNDLGQLGNGTTENAFVPVPVSGGHAFVDLALSVSHGCGIDGEGRAWCWGDNAAGQLGTGDLESRLVPAPVLGGLTFADIGVGTLWSCGLTPDGGAYCWGALAPDDVVALPSQVPGTEGRAFAGLGVGAHHACALERATGIAWCWGGNGLGELGRGYESALEPVAAAVAYSDSLASISVGDARSCALEPDGAALCWGVVGYDGRFDEWITALVPEPYRSELRFASISVGASFCGVTRSGGVSCLQESPLVFTAVASGVRHWCGVTDDGTVRCWGSRGGGALGDGLLTFHEAPQRIIGFSTGG